MRKNYLYFFFLVVLFVGCKKREPDTYAYVSAYGKSFSDFHTGSYWIYQNDSTLIIDSLYVKDSGDSIGVDIDYEDFSKHYYEINYCNIKSTANPNDTIYYYTIPTTVAYVFSDWYYGFNFHENTVNQSGYNDSMIYYPSMQLNGNTYNSVFEFIFKHVEYDYNLEKYVSKYRADAFVVSKIGLIKWYVHYTDSITQSASLLRSHIVM